MENSDPASRMAASKVRWLMFALQAMGVGSETFESDLVRILSGSLKQRAETTKILRELIANMDPESVRSLRNMLVHSQVDLDVIDYLARDLALHHPKPTPEERILSAIKSLLDPATEEDLQLMVRDFKRDRREMEAAGAGKRHVHFVMLVALARTLLDIAWEKLKEKLEPVLRFWR